MTASTVPPSRAVPVAKVISYTKKYTDPKRLIGAECHQTRFNGLSKDFYTYHLSKGEKKRYWKQVSDTLETSKNYELIEEFKSLEDGRKRGFPVYCEDLHYVHVWERFNPFMDIVVGSKVD